MGQGGWELAQGFCCSFEWGQTWVVETEAHFKPVFVSDVFFSGVGAGHHPFPDAKVTTSNICEHLAEKKPLKRTSARNVFFFFHCLTFCVVFTGVDSLVLFLDLYRYRQKNFGGGLCVDQRVRAVCL